MSFKTEEGECLVVFFTVVILICCSSQNSWGIFLMLIYVLSLHVNKQGRKIFWNVKNMENIRRG